MNLRPDRRGIKSFNRRWSLLAKINLAFFSICLFQIPDSDSCFMPVILRHSKEWDKQISYAHTSAFLKISQNFIWTLKMQC